MKFLGTALAVYPLLLAVALVTGGCAGMGSGAPPSTARALLLASCDTALDSRPVVVVDIDGTIVPETAGRMVRWFLGLECLGIRPLPGAAEGLARLAQDWHIVFLTARPVELQPQTLAWLDHHQFPPAPVLFAPYLLVGSGSRAAYKSRALAGLRARGLRPTHGIGDSPSDLCAFRRHGMVAVQVLEHVDDPGRRGAAPDAIAVQPHAWARIVEFLTAPEPACSAR